MKNEYQLKADSCGVRQMSQKEIRKERRRCWSPGCKHKAFLRDWAGWRWCPKHWWGSTAQKEGWGMFWTKFKLTKLF